MSETKLEQEEKRRAFHRARLEEGKTVGAVGGAVEPAIQCYCGHPETRLSSVHRATNCYLIPSGEPIARPVD